jgi:hypothetical protein
MTKQEAKVLSLEVWEYLVNHPAIGCECDLPEELFMKINNLPGYCPLCKVFNVDMTCSEDCPLYDCINPASNNLYNLWRQANTSEERRKSAVGILLLIQAWEPEEGE